MKESLSKKQSRFLWSLAKMILFANAAGYDVTMGRGFVTPEQNKLDSGIDGSLHCERLAMDLNLFRNGKYLTKTEDYKPLGDWWKAQGSDYFWGGDFTRNGKSFPDGNHFSVGHGGRK